jgi:UDP-N-acetylglucosamine 1-carboxyvinyltransferase
MDKIRIRGGNRLEGTINVSGAKNAALPQLASALLGTGRTSFKNVPDLNDVRTMAKLLRTLGCQVDVHGASVAITPPQDDAVECEAPYELVKTMRASIVVLGPLLAKYGRARVSLPGGCAIGARPIDQHLKGLQAMGAEVELSHGYVECRAKRLHGATIALDMPTVTGTENLMMAAALANGRTVLENAAREPEIEDLAHAINKMGGRVEGAGTTTIHIEGVDELKGIEHTIISDRIEAGTFMVAAAITGGDLLVKGANPDHLGAVISKLRSSGVVVDNVADGVRVRAPERIEAFDIATRPHPGFPTDMQAQFMVLASQAHGQTVITETIFENRFMHVPELCRMGASIEIDRQVAMIKGPTKLGGARVMATDLRASASLVLAGLIADGETEVNRVYHLDRGYEHMEEKLRGVGADIERTS